jgi:hypothetical protein
MTKSRRTAGAGRHRAPAFRQLPCLPPCRLRGPGGRAKPEADRLVDQGLGYLDGQQRQRLRDQAPSRRRRLGQLYAEPKRPGRAGQAGAAATGGLDLEGPVEGQRAGRVARHDDCVLARLTFQGHLERWRRGAAPSARRRLLDIGDLDTRQEELARQRRRHARRQAHRVIL